MKQKLVKECIIGALFELLKKQKYEKITVSNVIIKAGVCRATFYRNYHNLEEVVKDYLSSIFSNLNELYPLKNDSDLIYTHTLNAFKELLKHKDNFLLLGNNYLLYLLNDVIFDLTVQANNKLNEKADYYKDVFLTGGSSFVVRAWIMHNFKESPEELTNTIINKMQLM